MSSPLRSLKAALTGLSGFGASVRRDAEKDSVADAVAAADRARDNGEWETAIERYRAAFAAQPEALGIKVQLGHSLKESGRYAEAEECYRDFLTHKPEDPDINLQMGHLFFRQNRCDEAKEWYSKAELLSTPGSSIAADAARGREACERAPELALRQRALALTDRGRFQEAYVTLSELVIQYQCEDLTGILGNVCKELGRFAEALECYNRYESFARNKRPDLMFDSAVQQGHFAKVRHNYEQAMRHFLRAKALFASTNEPRVSMRDLECEIRLCLSQITKAIELL